MSATLYSIEKRNINGYEAYFLLVSSNNLFFGQKKRFIPAMAHYINEKKNKYVKLNKFPSRINESNYFYFIHAQDISQLQEFVKEHPDVELYINKLKEYLKSHK